MEYKIKCTHVGIAWKAKQRHENERFRDRIYSIAVNSTSGIEDGFGGESSGKGMKVNPTQA